MQSQSILAIRYSDDSILERHHCARAFEILKEEDSNLFANFTREEFAQCRKIVIQSILATDMSGHADLSRNLALLPDDVFETMDKDSPPQLFNTFFSSILHTGDLSGQALPLRQALKWGERVLTEFISQANRESALGLPVAPFMINLKNPQRAANVQKGYIDFILRPWWVQITRFFPDNQDLKKSLGYIDAIKAFYVGASEKEKGEEKDRDHARIIHANLEAQNTLRKDEALHALESGSAENGQKEDKEVKECDGSN